MSAKLYNVFSFCLVKQNAKNKNKTCCSTVTEIVIVVAVVAAVEAVRVNLIALL